MHQQHQERLMAFLVSEPAFVWQDILRSRYLQKTATYAFGLLDWVNGSVLDGWDTLDNPKRRKKLFEGRIAWNELSYDVVHRKGLRASYNSFLKSSHLREVNSTDFANAVNVVVPALVNRVSSLKVFEENPFPDAWGLLANIVAGVVHKRTHPAFPEPEWKLMNGLLLAGFFTTCRLPKAAHVAQLLKEHTSVLLSVRGTFMRIPETIGPDGILDQPVSISGRAEGKVKLASTAATLSPFVAAAENEANLTFDGKGLLHRMIPVNHTPIFMKPHVAELLRTGRDTSFRLYEYTIVTFLALSAIEYLLRTWAQHLNINSKKGNGLPNGVLEWVDHLGCSKDLLNAVRELYASDRANIRNRVLHGNLLEIHTKRLEVYLPVIQPRTFGRLGRDVDSYKPDNIAQHCLDCLERIDSEMAGFTIDASDTTWHQSIMLTSDEIDFGHQVYCDFFGPNAVRWANTISDYLNAVMPALKQLYTIGFIEWMRGQYQLNAVTSMIMGYVYEAMHRLTVHLLSADVAGIHGGTIQKGHQKAGQISHFQYRMLDTRQDGLFSEHVLDRILQHVSVPEQGTARRILCLAMKARNALAHGALTQVDKYTLDGIGHIFAKAVQTLVTSGLHHFTKERAYFIHRDEHPQENGRDAEDWGRAERDVFEYINRVAREAVLRSDMNANYAPTL